MESEKVKVIKEYLRCMRGEKACWDCGLNEIAENQDTCCINLVADMALDIINELESENEKLKNIGLNEEITVGEYLRENQQLKDRIAELEKEKTELLERGDYQKGYDEAVKMMKDTAYDCVKEAELKHFAEMLIEKKVKLGDRFNIYDIDETLKEFYQ